MRIFKNGRVYDTEKSICLNFSISKDYYQNKIFRGLYQKKNNKEHFYYFENKTNKNERFVIPVMDCNVKNYNDYISCFNA